MLDAFVYDPLVDWAAAQDDLGSRSMIGVATVLAVYGSKFYMFLIVYFLFLAIVVI